jgi:hypothetical protein
MEEERKRFFSVEIMWGNEDGEQKSQKLALCREVANELGQSARVKIAFFSFHTSPAHTA